MVSSRLLQLILFGCWIALTRSKSNFMDGYVFTNDVTDQLNFDQDIQTISYLISGNENTTVLQQAKKVYEQGAYMGSYAELNVFFIKVLPFPARTKVRGISVLNKNNVTGTLVKPTNFLLTTELIVDYDTLPDATKNDPNYFCSVGGSPYPEINGCFKERGRVRLGSRYRNYNYNPLLDNKNRYTLQKFSTNRAEFLNKKKKYYADFQLYVNYYGTARYADLFVHSAFDGTKLEYPTGRIFDFTSFSVMQRGDAAYMGSMVLNTFMKVIGQLERSIDTCTSGGSAIADLDKAVAYYVGSIPINEEDYENTQYGYGMHRLAWYVGRQFRTCGFNGMSPCGTFGNVTSGWPKVSLDIFDSFKSMKANYTIKNCIAPRASKDTIASKLYIPLIQATYFYMYIAKESCGYKETFDAWSYTTLAALLPKVASCSSTDAKTIFENLSAWSTKANLALIKATLERNYVCLGIKCKDVGGLFNFTGGGGYEPGLSPCVSP